MNFKDQLRASKAEYEKGKTYEFSQERVNAFADKVIEDVKNEMLEMVRAGAITRGGLFKKDKVWCKKSISFEKDRPHYLSQRELTTPFYTIGEISIGCYDKREFNSLVSRLKVLGAANGIEVLTSKTYLDTFPKIVFSSEI